MSFQSPKNVQDFLENYDGPYPLHQLRNARDTLIYGFNTYNSHTFHRLYRLMYLENFSHDSNWEYSEDDYSDSEVETEPMIEPKLGPKAEGKPKAQHGLCPEQKTEGRSKADPSKSECRSEASNTPVYSAAGFKNRFAQQLLGKKAVDILKKKAFEKTLYNTNLLEVKRKSLDIKTNCTNGEDLSAENGDTDDYYCHSIHKKAKINLDLSVSEKVLLKGFKCDYCNYTSLDSSETYSHLRRAQHQSASRCEGELANGKFSPCYIAEEMCLQSDQKSSTKIATCPKCFTVFSNIYSCASHSMNCLENSNSDLDGLYAVSDVVRDVNILIPVDSICQVCKLKCSKHRALNLHYEACRHYPFDEPISPEVLLSFLCPYCKKDFTNFFVAKAHVITHALKQPRVLMALQLIYYKKTTIGHRLLPQQQFPVKSPTCVKSTKRKRSRRRNFE